MIRYPTDINIHIILLLRLFIPPPHDYITLSNMSMRQSDLVLPTWAIDMP